MSLCPPYLPWEFPQLFVIVSYIHLRANEKASKAILEVTQKLQSVSPDVCSTEFRNCLLNEVLKNFNQYAPCHTRQNKILDQCYGSIKGAYKSLSLPLLGTFNNNCVLWGMGKFSPDSQRTGLMSQLWGCWVACTDSEAMRASVKRMLFLKKSVRVGPKDKWFKWDKIINK